MSSNKRVLWMLPVLAVLLWLTIFGEDPAGSGVAEAVRRVSGSNAAGAAGAGEVPVESSAPAPFGRDAVRAALAIAKPVNLFGNGQAQEEEAVADEGEPVPAPDFRVIGRMLRDGRWIVFLDKDNQTHVATPGAVFADFRVDVVRANSLQLTHLPTRSTHVIPIEGEQ